MKTPQIFAVASKMFFFQNGNSSRLVLFKKTHNVFDTLLRILPIELLRSQEAVSHKARVGPGFVLLPSLDFPAWLAAAGIQPEHTMPKLQL